MSFQQSAFQQNAFQISVPGGGAAAQPQRLHLWAPAALIAFSLLAPDDTHAVNHHQLHALRSPPAAGGAPWPLLAPQTRRDQAEEETRRGDHTALHRYRVGYQTVGQQQQVLRWKTSQPEQSETYTVTAARPDLHRYRQAFQTVGQNYRQWPPQAKADQALEPDAQRVNQALLHRYRTGYQTVGQSWQYWGKPQARVDSEAFSVPGPASLHQYRSVALQVGQPWWIWPRAIADQTCEPNPIVTNHAAVLLPFRQTAPGGGGAGASTLEWPTVWTWTDRPKWRWSVSGNRWVVTS